MAGHNEPQRGIQLSTQTLGELDSRVLIPGYARRELGGGIVHVGVGGFHRAHQAVYLDDLCRAGVADWSITGAGVLPGDTAMAAALEAAGLPLHAGHPRQSRHHRARHRFSH